MSTTPTNYELDTAPVEMSEVVEAPVAEEIPVEEATPKKSNNAWSKICSIFLAILALVPFILPIGVVVAGNNNGYSVSEMSLLSVVTALFTDGGMLAPAGADRLLGLLYNIVLYALVLSSVLAVLFAIISLISTKAAPALAKTSATLIAVVFACYAIAYFVLLSYWGKFEGDIMNRLDLITAAVAAVAFIIYTILCGQKAGKMVWLNLLQFIIALAYTALLAIAFVAEGKNTFKFMEATDSRMLMLGLIAVVLVNLFIAYITMSCKKTKVLALIRSIIMLGVAAGIFVIALTSGATYIESFKSYVLYAVIVAVAAIVISILPLLKKKVKVVEEAAPVPELELAEVEVAEAVAYEGGPIPVEMAEEAEPVEEAPAPVLPPVETADYDYYNSRSFDPFIASLSYEERNQFTELFILHYKGTLEALPEYQVGGDNKEFFRAIFINLGMYRDRIPDGLLEKIYKFAIRL